MKGKECKKESAKMEAKEMMPKKGAANAKANFIAMIKAKQAKK